MRAGTALMDAARDVMRWPLAAAPADARTRADRVGYAPPATPTASPAAEVAHVLDEAHADLAQPDLTALLLAVRGAVSGPTATQVTLPPAARPYQQAIGALMQAPDGRTPDVRTGVADYVDDVAARPPGAGAPRD
jgi:hypothetical protein